MKQISTRAKILDQGLHMLSTSGFAGVTIGALAERVGMSKSGLFAHFKSKEAVQEALLDQSAAAARRYVIEPAMRAAKGLPRLRSLVEHWMGWSAKAGLGGGCPVAAALFELDDDEGEIRNMVAAMDAQWHELLLELVRQAIKCRHLRSDIDAEQFVWELEGIYLSHHASLRFRRDRHSNRRATTAFSALVARAEPAPLRTLHTRGRRAS